jgi:aminopeptidase YwaD
LGEIIAMQNRKIITSINTDDNRYTILTIYPNPAQNYVNIKMPIKMHPSKISIIDINGKTVKIFIINDNSALLNLNELESGVYFVKVLAREMVEIKKLIINKL